MGKLTGPAMAEVLLKQHAGLKDDVHGAETPTRWINTLEEMTYCRETDGDIDHLKDCIKWKVFPTESEEMVVVSDINFVSLCNHHMLPFIGKAHIGYVPEGLHAGLSKFARVVKHFSRQLQVQERLTNQIADFLAVYLQPKGVVVMMQAEHMCMTIRGIHAPGTLTTTSDVRGVFADHKRTAKAEFLEIIRGR